MLKNAHHSDMTGIYFWQVGRGEIIYAFTVILLCPVFIEDKCYIISQWHFVRDPNFPSVLRTIMFRYL